MDYGRETLHQAGLEKIFDDNELDRNIAKMLKLEPSV
jgi:hypothetical protein